MPPGPLALERQHIEKHQAQTLHTPSNADKFHPATQSQLAQSNRDTPQAPICQDIHMKMVARVDNLASLKAHIAQNLPCIYQLPTEQRLEHLQRWSKEQLSTRVGSTQVKVRHSPTKSFVDPDDPLRAQVQSMLLDKMSFSEYLESGLTQGKIMSGTETYIYERGGPTKQWASLWEDACKLLREPNPQGDNPEHFFPMSALHTVGLWVSGPGISSILHYDYTSDNNLNFQLDGQKRITLFPPADWPHLNTLLAMGMHGFAQYRQLYEQTPNPTDETKSLPPLEHTHPHTAQLSAGDVLYIPSNWYHFVEHVGEFNVNLTCWFAPDTLAPRPNTHGNLAQKRPGQSCRDLGLVLRLLTALLIASTLNLLWQLTGLRIGKR